MENKAERFQCVSVNDVIIKRVYNFPTFQYPTIVWNTEPEQLGSFCKLLTMCLYVKNIPFIAVNSQTTEVFIEKLGGNSVFWIRFHVTWL